MILRCLQVFYGGLGQNSHVYSGVPRVNRGDTPESWHAVCLTFGKVTKYNFFQSTFF